MDTHIALPPELTARIEREANARGISVAEFVRESLEHAIALERPEDPLFADTAVYHDDGSDDFASNHDEYLYGDSS